MRKKAKSNPPFRGKLISKRKAAERLGVSIRTISRMMHNRELSYCKPLNRILIPEHEIDALITNSWCAASLQKEKGTS